VISRRDGAAQVEPQGPPRMRLFRARKARKMCRLCARGISRGRGGASVWGKAELFARLPFPGLIRRSRAKLYYGVTRPELDQGWTLSFFCDMKIFNALGLPNPQCAGR
jgi:hypothetical protein